MLSMLPPSGILGLFLCSPSHPEVFEISYLFKLCAIAGCNGDDESQFTTFRVANWLYQFNIEYYTKKCLPNFVTRFYEIEILLFFTIDAGFDM